jgi:hypothetical protein
MDFILHLWLKTVPDYAVVFCQIRVMDWCLCMFFTPCHFSITATGKIKNFLIIDSILTVQNFIFTYIFFYLGFSPVAVPIIYICVNIVRIAIIILFARALIKFSINDFICRVVLKLSTVVLISVPLPIFVIFHTENLEAMFATILSFILPFLLSSIFFGLDKNERTMIFSLVKKKFNL